MKYNIKNIDELGVWICSFMEKIKIQKQAAIICLRGDLGSGKTTCAQFIGSYLNISEPVTSPTFVIQKHYPVIKHPWIQTFIHIDAYRLEHKNDLEYLGWNELITNPNNLIVIEWPEMVEGIDMPKANYIDIEINPDHTRTITTL